jgi:hypothetical protein
MTDQPIETTPPAPESAPDPALPADWGKAPDGEPLADAASSSRAREWLSQLETMIQQMATQDAPVARDIGAKAAELAAVAAVKAGPAAQKAAAVTTEYGQKFAEKAQSVAADWRHENEAAKSTGDAATDAPADAAPEPPTDPAASI